MTHRVAWPDSAVDQLDRIVAYIELFDPRAAKRMAQRLYALGESLTEFPHRGRLAAHGTRELTSVPPYIMQYLVEGDLVTIVAIRHGAQHPED